MMWVETAAINIAGLLRNVPCRRLSPAKYAFLKSVQEKKYGNDYHFKQNQMYMNIVQLHRQYLRDPRNIF